MNAPRPGNLSGPTAARGVVIIAAAVVLGAVLLARGGHGSLIDRASSHPRSSTTVQADTPSIPLETTTSTPPPTNPPASVKVDIFNGTGGALPNAAGDNMRKLTPHGYTQVNISDTTATDKSVIYYAEGAQGDAAAIAQLLGLPTQTPVPSSQAASLPAGSTGAQVIVVVGADAAGSSSKTTN